MIFSRITIQYHDMSANKVEIHLLRLASVTSCGVSLLAQVPTELNFLFGATQLGQVCVHTNLRGFHLIQPAIS